MAVNQRDLRVDRGPEARYATPPYEEPPLGELFRDLSDDATRLIRQEVELAKLELRETASALGKDAAKIGVAAGLAVVGGLAATAFLIVALGDLLDNYWLSSLIVAALFLGVGAVLGKQAMDDVKHRELKPARTIETLQSDAEWAKQEAAAVKRDWQS